MQELVFKPGVGFFKQLTKNIMSAFQRYTLKETNGILLNCAL